jgi:PilZ domain
MEKQRYCVYNQTSECFLSLGVTVGTNTLVRLKGIFTKGFWRSDEGCWLTRPQGLNTVGVLSSRDLIYLDENHKVMDVIESFPRFCTAPERRGARSLVALPPRAISSSQTQPGNQLVICRAEEMEFRLRSTLQSALDECMPAASAEKAQLSKNWLPPGSSSNRRSAMRKRWPRLVAYDSKGSAVAVHGVRDISATGIYVMTEERWPVGAQVKMSLQRTDSIDENAMNPITVQLRVSRWGADGVGLEFIQPESEETALMAMTVR